MARRRPIKVEYVKTVHYSTGRRPRAKRWSWPVLVVGVVALFFLLRLPVLALLVGAGIWYWWRKQNGRYR